ncbi:MAG: hypothetical protein ACOC0N_04660, partial [Chroococcales cyanobacterium]
MSQFFAKSLLEALSCLEGNRVWGVGIKKIFHRFFPYLPMSLSRHLPTSLPKGRTTFTPVLCARASVKYDKLFVYFYELLSKEKKFIYCGFFMSF